MKNLRLRPGLTLTLLAAFGSLTSAHAALVWTADFQSYTNNSELVVNSTGANNTFSTAPTIQGASGSVNATGTRVYTPTQSAPEKPFWNASYVPPGSFLATTNLALRVQIDGSGTISLRFGQSSFSNSTFSSGVQVVSFDSMRDQRGNGFSVNGDAIDNGTTIGARDVPGAPDFRRVTIVTNLSGSNITLPGSLGTLASGNTITYWTADGSSFFASSNAPASATISGTGLSLNGFNTGITATSGSKFVAWFDNFGVWNSPSDLYNGTSVLAIAPTTQIIAPIPEPSTFAALAGLFALGCAANSRRRASRS